MENSNSKRQEFKNNLRKISVDEDDDENMRLDPAVDAEIRKSFEILSPVEENPQSETPVNLNVPFPDLSDDDSDLSQNNSEKDPNVYVPHSPELNAVSSWSSAGDFDHEVKRTVLEMVEENAVNPEIHIFIVNSWFELAKMKPGEPGIKLAEMLKKLPDEKLTPTALNQCFSQLDDLRTTIGTEESSILFYLSSLTLFQSVVDYPDIADCAYDLCIKSITTASKILGDPIYKLYCSSLELEHPNKKILEIAEELTKMRKEIVDKGGLFLYNCVVDAVDCQLANNSIINHLASTLSKAVHANTSISTIEAENHTKMKRFQQSLLVVIASDTILDGTDKFKELVPLIPPNLIYMILCNLKPDEMNPDKIDYKLIDRFMTQNNCNLSVSTNELLLHPENPAPDDLLSVAV